MTNPPHEPGRARDAETPHPMRPRPVCHANPVPTRSDLVAYSAMGDMSELRVSRLKITPPPLTWAWKLKRHWASYILFGRLYVQQDDTLGVALISFPPESYARRNLRIGIGTRDPSRCLLVWGRIVSYFTLTLPYSVRGRIIV